MAKQISVYIGRFQPLHLGHTYTIRQALENDGLLVILIGSAFQARTIKNPFTFEERRDMIHAYLLSQNISVTRTAILPLPDQPYNNSKWIRSVQEQVDNAVEIFKTAEEVDEDIQLIGSDRDDSTWYLKSFPQFKLKLLSPIMPEADLSATKVRKRLFNKEPFTEYYHSDWRDVPLTTLNYLRLFDGSSAYNQLREEYHFIEKYKQAWKAAPYAPTFLTVDAIVIQSGHVLVVERGALPGKGLWALPGGFLNQDEQLVDAAIRELVEETGIKIPAPILKGSIKAKEIFDDPNRSLRGRTVTTAFLIQLDDTKPLPKVKGQNVPAYESGGKDIVETAKAFWLPISEARANPQNFFEDHHSLLDWAVGSIKD